MNIFPDIRKKELILTESYKISVNVKFHDRYYAGVLELTPETIVLRIMGNENIKCDNEYKNVICKCVSSTPIFLERLKIISLFSIPISQLDNITTTQSNISYYYEVSFDVSSIIYYPFRPIYVKGFSGINVYSKAINDWISETITQQKLIDCIMNTGNVFINCPDLLNEFNLTINNFGTIGIFYKVHPQSEYLKSGVEITPYFFIRFNSEKTEKETTDSFYHLYNLLALIIGHDFVIEKIEFFREDFNNGGISSLFPTFYYPSLTKKILNAINSRSAHSHYCLFPLSKELRYGSPWDLPQMPLEIFSNYFNLIPSELGYYEKYIRYRRMENIEERFLGYFKILESLTFVKKPYLNEVLLNPILDKAEPYLEKKFNDTKNVKSFIKKIKYSNTSKYNTESCFQQFFKKISNLFSEEFLFKQSDFAKICKLRNDISHANDYYINEDDLKRYTKFIEILLMFALFDKIGISMEIVAKIIHRLDDYELMRS